MTTRRRAALSVPLVAVLWVGGAEETAAQLPGHDGKEGPLRKVFAERQQQAPEEGHAFSISVMTFGGFDEGGRRRPTLPQLTSDIESDAAYGGAGLGLAYALRSRDVTAEARSETAARYYPAYDRPVDVRHQMGASVARAFGARNRVEAAGTFRRTPRFSLMLTDVAFDASPVVAAADFGIVERAGMSATGRLSASRALSRRTLIEADYAARWSEYDQRDLDVREDVASASLRHRLSPHATLHLGYGYRHGILGLGDTPRKIAGHELDAGIDYLRPISLGRDTTFSFGTGSTIVTRERRSGDRETRLRVLGHATLTHHIGRTWLATAEYRRANHLVEGLEEPVFADGAIVALGGQLARRVDLLVSGTYSTGGLAFTTSGDDIEARTAAARAHLRLWRGAVVFGDYFYYEHRFGPEVRAAAGLPRRFDRQGVRVGVIQTVKVF